MKETAFRLEGGFLRFLLAGGNAFVNAGALLEDIPADRAVTPLSAETHTIAEIVAHLNYWQNWFYAGATAEALTYPETNDLSWPEVEAEAWDDLRTGFLAQLEAVKALCDDTALLERAFVLNVEPGVTVAGGHGERSVGQTLLYTVALHNAHHYGQIITARQLMRLWPPRGGGVTW